MKVSCDPARLQAFFSRSAESPCLFKVRRRSRKDPTAKIEASDRETESEPQGSPDFTADEPFTVQPASGPLFVSRRGSARLGPSLLRRGGNIISGTRDTIGTFAGNFKCRTRRVRFFQTVNELIAPWILEWI